jgi:hypothetical protein
MTGVPRVLADPLAGLWKEAKNTEPNSFDDIRTWVRRVSDKEWNSVIPVGSNLTPSDIKLLCNELVG